MISTIGGNPDNIMDTNENNNKQIRVIINKKEELLPDNMTVLELLRERQERRRSAVWINGTQLLLSEYPLIKIQEGDVIKILKVVAGG